MSHDRLKELLSIFDQEANAKGLSGLQRQQYALQREWFAQGNVPAVELILWSKGFLNVEQGESYAVMLGGLMVSDCRYRYSTVYLIDVNSIRQVVAAW